METAVHMRRALELARGVLGTTSPNPAVGCVIVKDGVVVGEGATQPPGGLHAEKVALAQAGAKARGATMYVTLEPCCHFGRTPPCSTEVIKAGIREVQCALQDPNPLVAGKGRRELESAGITVAVGLEAAAAQQVNEGFLKWIQTKQPFVHAKFAMSLDGKIATTTGESRWITGEAARAVVHEWRASTDAILIGANTAIKDDPRLTVRDAAGQERARQPLRVVVDSSARTPSKAALLRPPGKALIAVTHRAANPERRALQEAGAEVLQLPSAKAGIDLVALMQALGERSVTNLLAEGGGTLLGSLLDAGLVDRISAFVAPVVIGGAAAPTPMGGQGARLLSEAHRLQRVERQQLGEDTLISGYVGAW